MTRGRRVRVLPAALWPRGWWAVLERYHRRTTGRLVAEFAAEMANAVGG